MTLEERCDKCGGQVNFDCSVVSFDLAIGDLRAITVNNRHLFEQNGCEGSPSRRVILKQLYAEDPDILGHYPKLTPFVVRARQLNIF